jgi:molybdenum cofactor biosynthesis enzyme MoaA
LTVDSGTLPGRDKGAQVYIKVLETIKARLGYLPNLLYRRAVIEPPLDFEWLQRLADAGFTDIQMDVDVYDAVERRHVMPNAKGHRPIADYIKAFRKAKEIFPGEVATQLVAGIQNDENLLKGVEHFASEGIPTLLTPFLPFGHGRAWRESGEVDVPSAERMKTIYQKAAAILTRYNVPPPQFRGGVSSLAETMGRRLKRVKALTHPRDLSHEPISVAA